MCQDKQVNCVMDALTFHKNGSSRLQEEHGSEIGIPVKKLSNFEVISMLHIAHLNQRFIKFIGFIGQNPLLTLARTKSTKVGHTHSRHYWTFRCISWSIYFIRMLSFVFWREHQINTNTLCLSGKKATNIEAKTFSIIFFITVRLTIIGDLYQIKKGLHQRHSLSTHPRYSKPR